MLLTVKTIAMVVNVMTKSTLKANGKLKLIQKVNQSERENINTGIF